MGSLQGRLSRVVELFVVISSVAFSLEARATAPLPPTNFSVTPSNGTNSLSWTESSGAVSYNVKRTVSATGYYLKIANVTSGTAYTDSGLTDNETYYYEVTALDSAGEESTPAGPVSGTPTLALNPPTTFSCTPGNGQVVCNWNSAPNANLYLLSRSGTQTGVYTIVNGGNPISALTFTDTGLTNGVAYWYEIQSLTNEGNVSAQSPPVSATPFLPIKAPTNLVATPGDGKVSLSWAAGSLAKTYNVARSPTQTGTYTSIATGLTALSYADSGLTNKQTYFYEVTSVSGGVQSSPSAPVSATPVTSLQPPTGVLAKAGDTQVSLGWTAPTSGSAPTSYNIKRSTSATGTYTLVNSATTLTYVNTGLTNAETYYYEITSVNSGGESAPSAPVSVTPVTSLQAPTGVLATAGDTQVSLSWTAPTAGSEPTSYNVKRSTAASGPFTLVGSPSTLSFTNTGLTNKEAYYYEITSVNAGGESAPSAVVTATPVTSLQPPTSVVATAGNHLVSLAWVAPTKGSAPTSYNVKQSVAAAGPFTLVTSVTGLSDSVTNLSDNETYYYEVTSVNAGGESAPSAVVAATPKDPLVAPSGLAAVAGNAQVSLTWSAETIATGYLIGRSTAASGPFTSVTGSTPITGTSYVDTGLLNGEAYYYVISALNGADQSANSSAISATPTSALVFKQISQDGYSGCGLTAAGQTYCWGYDVQGTGTDPLAPVPVPQPAGVTFTQISSGTEWSGSCGLTAIGQAYCWGSISLGNGTDISSGAPFATIPTPVTQPAGVTFTQVSSAEDTTCALSTVGQVYCWGWDYGSAYWGANVVSDADGYGAIYPMQIPLPTGVKLTQISTAPQGSGCGVTATGQGYCWGISDTDNVGTVQAVEQPAGVSFTQITAVGAGTYSYYVGPGETLNQTFTGGCGITAQGQAYCWGTSWNGVLGNNSTFPAYGITQLAVPVTQPPGVSFTGITAVSYSSLCGLTPAGTLYCWGYNYEGQLGNGTQNNALVPTPVTQPVGVKFGQVTSGNAYVTCALATTGQAYCWGQNAFGALGTTSSANSLVPSAVNQY